MKKYILLFFLLSLLPCLSTACSDDDGSSTPNLTVGKETVDFNSESGSQNVAVTTNVRENALYFFFYLLYIYLT